jgi:predicted permease
MKALRRLWCRLRGTVSNSGPDEELVTEFESHLRMQTDANIRAGMSLHDARRAAVLKFGNVEAAKERYRDERTLPQLTSLASDMRFALRSIVREPRLTTVAVILTALVVGGNATIYSTVHGLLSKPAPGVRANRLVVLNMVRDGRVLGPETTYRNYMEFAAQSETVRPIVASGFERFTVGLQTGVYALRGALVSPNYFETLGVRPARGRIFTDGECRTDAGGLVAIISDRFWRNELQGLESIVGLAVALNGHAATVVGVAPPTFQGATIGESADVWVPLPSYGVLRQRVKALDDWTRMPVVVIGKLAPHTALPEAGAEIRLIAERLERKDRNAFDGNTVALDAYSMLGTGSPIHQQAPRFMTVFSVVTALTLLVVCANVANLMLARSLARRREIAVRLALGASRGRILRLLLFEGFGVALIAWAVACLMATALAHGLAALIPPDARGAVITPDFTPDWQVATYAMALSVLAGFLFTVAPAVRAWRQDVLPALKAGQQSVIQGRSRMARGLVIVQLAFSVLLLTSAGLAYRSLLAITDTNLGFNSEGVLLVTVNTSGVASGSSANGELLERVRDRLRSLPGVQAVSYARGVPGTGWAPEELRTDASAEPMRAQRNDVGPDFFKVLSVAISGEDLVRARPTGPDLHAVINRSLAQTLWPGSSPLARRLAVRSGHRVEVVGVVPDGFFSGFERDMRGYFIFVSLAQAAPDPGELTFYVKSGSEAGLGLASIAPAIRVALREVDDDIPVVYMRTMEAQLGSVTWLTRVLTVLLVVFAAGALVIAVLGQYSVMEFSVRRGIREFGVRMTLGATPTRIVRSVVREGLHLTAFGLVVGFALSVFAGNACRALLVGVAPIDAVTYMGVLLTLGSVSMLACYLPARRASNISLAHALREE